MIGITQTNQTLFPIYTGKNHHSVISFKNIFEKMETVRGNCQIEILEGQGGGAYIIQQDSAPLYR